MVKKEQGWMVEGHHNKREGREETTRREKKKIEIVSFQSSVAITYYDLICFFIL